MPETQISPEDIDKAFVELPEDAEIPSIDKYNKLVQRFNQVSAQNTERKRTIESLETEKAALQRKVETNQILDKLIEPMSRKIFGFMCWYCVFVASLIVVVFLTGKSFPVQTMNILVGSTAVTVIGLVGTIVAGIFAGARRAGN